MNINLHIFISQHQYEKCVQSPQYCILPNSLHERFLHVSKGSNSNIEPSSPYIMLSCILSHNGSFKRVVAQKGGLSVTCRT